LKLAPSHELLTGMLEGLRSKRVLVCSVMALVGCQYARTPYLLKALNSGVGSGAPPARATPSERIARETRMHVEDSYFNPTTVGAWMAAVGAASDPIALELGCLRGHRADSGPCYTRLADDAPALWNLPKAPLAQGATAVTLPAETDPAYLIEIDEQRFIANVGWIASSLLVLEDSLGRPLTADELRTGIQTGMQQASAYLQARRGHRQATRPATALVMSGGGATGAFTAGFISRLMDVFQTCHHAPPGDACPDAKIDLVVGTSTGTLIGVLVDLFQVPGQEARAQRTLIDNYTCSTEKDLYCQYDEYDWHLAENLRGLMHFQGIEKKLTDTLSPAMQMNPSELVTVAVDYDSGDVFAQSDQDPADTATGADRVQTVLASIVEPVLSDPVDYLTSHGKKLPGTFIDAGVRSGLPMLQAVWRGAERTLVVSTSSIDVSPVGHASSALPILLRTIDLATSQNLSGELQQAEFEAVARRWAEYTLCKARLAAVGTIDRERFCKRDTLWPPKGPQAQAAAASFVGPGLFPEVAKTWKSVWVNRPENGAPGAVGYTFDPRQMRELFKDGVRTFQRRCQESLELMNVPADVRAASYACGMAVDAAVAGAERSFQPLPACHPDDHEIPQCGK
jgi:predicted acylesterase/phospholipase RssA